MMKKIISIVSIIAIIIVALTFTGCGRNKSEEEKKVSIVGTWKIEAEVDLDYKYVFNEDGTGAYQYNGAELKFTYEDNGNSIKIMFDGSPVASEVEYKIEGDILTIKDSFDKDVKYKKQ